MVVGVLIIWVLVLVMGCTGYMPIVKRGATGVGIVAKDYDIIAPIRIEASIESGRLKYSTTFDALTAKAQEMGGDDVINIAVDYEYFYFLGLFPIARQILMNGLVVKYKDADSEVEGSSGNASIGAPVPPLFAF